MRKIKESLRLRFGLGMQQDQIALVAQSVKRPFTDIWKRLVRRPPVPVSFQEQVWINKPQNSHKFR